MTSRVSTKAKSTRKPMRRKVPARLPGISTALARLLVPSATVQRAKLFHAPLTTAPSAVPGERSTEAYARGILRSV